MKDSAMKTYTCEMRTGPMKVDRLDSSEIKPLQNSSSASYTSRTVDWCSKKCTVNLLKRRVPIIEWLPKYSIEDLKGDLIAGMTVALTVIPQGLALASLANLPPQYGLYTAFMGCFMYTIFGSCKDLTIGPTAIMSLMTAEHSATGGVVYVILITFLSGCIQLLMGILNLGFLVTFISSSVVSGFTSAAAITIATTQISGIFGMNSKSEGFIDDVYNFFSGISQGNIRYWDMTMGFCSIAFLLMLKYCNRLQWSCCGSSMQRIMETLLRTVSIARNALLVLSCAGIAAILISYDIDELSLTHSVKAGLPPFELPSFSYHAFDNVTNKTIDKDFLDIVEDMGSGLVIIPLLCLLEAIAIAKSFSKGKKIDATQEMIAIGICNIMGAFVSSYPATGSFSRTAINYSSGVRTTAGGIVTGTLVLLALGFMSPYFRFIPKASLSALIFISVLNMVHYEDVVLMWRTNKMDLVPFCVTFFLSFILGLEYGIMIGIAISVCLLILQVSKPKFLIEERQTYLGCRYLYVKPDRTILFPSAEKLQTKILKAVPDQSDKTVCCVLIDGEHLTTADYTMSLNMKSLTCSLKNENIKIIFINLKIDVQNSLKGSGPIDFIYFSTKEDAENYIDAMSVCQNTTSYCIAFPRHSLRSDDVSLDGS
ncbi:sodium-independent sulfate anion transporter [Trichonephila inaurata madagascariensis]|uniref:Sodium-independent sulfate anion transporter n=1 Tax=Trichonephila inaurata madagascariensis TaxID=2747483 RepID=A0A8X7BUB7_9ARAC|nr:sodium-independent sulfate anion transporter [Trichonephila inaurata madagascariensis]